MINSKPTVLFLEGKSNGCNFYRLRQPYHSLLKSEKVLVASSADLSGDDLEVWLETADIIITQCSGEKFLEFVEERQGNTKFVFDFDDNPFDVSPYNPSYREHGTKEVDIEVGGQTIEIRDGMPGFSIAENKKKLFIFREALKIADVVTTPSSILAGLFRNKGAKKTQVIRNKIDTNWAWKPLPLKKNSGEIRIGWQGGWSHYPDLMTIKNTIRSISATFPQVKFIIMGTFFEDVFDGVPMEKIERHPWVDTALYPWVFKSLNIDIGLAPIASNVFNTCKSELKWEEYGALGIPCVASNIAPYSLAIWHQTTGYLASKESEWHQYISELVNDAGKRHLVGSSAREAVLSGYDATAGAAEYEDLFLSLIGKPSLIVPQKESYLK